MTLAIVAQGNHATTTEAKLKLQIEYGIPWDFNIGHSVVCNPIYVLTITISSGFIEERLRRVHERVNGEKQLCIKVNHCS